MNNLVITFARGFGSGGKEIASKLAKELNVNCYENRILQLASQLSGLDATLFEHQSEKLKAQNGLLNILKSLPKTKHYIAKNEKFDGDDILFYYQKQIITDLAASESCVIVGKCADWILRGNPNVISIYIEAPRDFCLKRTVAHMQVSETVAGDTITKTDKYRADYYDYYTGGNYWTNPINYDLTLNSEKIGIDNCVSLIKEYIKIKYPNYQLEQIGFHKEER